MLEAIASPLKIQKLQGSPLMKPVGMNGIAAYEESWAARKVEVLKSPHGQTVNGVMDEIVAALKAGKQPVIRHREAFASAIDYLTNGSVVEREPDGTLKLT